MSRSRALRIPPVAIPARVHDDLHVLLWQVRGATDFGIEGTAVELRADHALWMPAGVTHEFVVRADSVMLPVFFEVATTATTLSGVTLVPIDDDVRLLCLTLVQAQNSIIQPAINLQRQLLGLIEQIPAVPAGVVLPASPAARAVAEALLLNPGDDRLIEEWADHVHVSARSIQRAFVAETGMTLQQWRLACRMESAAILLREASSVAAVARRVGYDNHSAFGRVFKAHFGMAPREYALTHRGDG